MIYSKNITGKIIYLSSFLHDETRKVEEYILASMGDYICFETVLCVDCNGIKQVELYYESDVDDILTIIDHMPDLECVVVRSLYDIKDTLSELRPDITFIER